MCLHKMLEVLSKQKFVTWLDPTVTRTSKGPPPVPNMLGNSCILNAVAQMTHESSICLNHVPSLLHEHEHSDMDSENTMQCSRLRILTRS
jgi:hypothetical protein